MVSAGALLVAWVPQPPELLFLGASWCRKAFSQSLAGKGGRLIAILFNVNCNQLFDFSLEFMFEKFQRKMIKELVY